MGPVTYVSSALLGESGEVLGNGLRGPFTWSPPSPPTLLRPVTAPHVTTATATNGRGLVVGYASPPGAFAPTPIAWRHGVRHALAVPPGTRAFAPQDVNSSGQTCGYDWHASGPVGYDPVLLDAAGQSIPLVTTPSPILGGALLALNDAGVAVGAALAASGDWQALYFDGREARLLPNAPGMIAASLSDVNRHGTAIGFARATSSPHLDDLEPIVTDGTTYTFLQDRIAPPSHGLWDLVAVTSINRRGVIAGVGTPVAGWPPGSAPQRLLLLTPTR